MLTSIRPIEHFKEMVGAAIEHQRIKTNESAEFYLSSLLSDFILRERLNDEPLAITYIKALGAGRELQIHLLKQLGDISLFTSGFFSDSLSRKIVDIDYYILMGEASYGYLASIHKQRSGHKDISVLYSELAAKFKLFVDVLAEVSERSRLTSSRDILRVYERWLRTKSRQAEKILRDLGIEPM
ncbi:MAG: hypothetical protein AAB356_03805, partial [Deltaproteobacteria bacterium]